MINKKYSNIKVSWMRWVDVLKKLILCFLIVWSFSLSSNANTNLNNIEAAKSLLAINKPDKALQQIEIAINKGEKFNNYAKYYLECLIQLHLISEFYNFIEKNSYQIICLGDKDRSNVYQKIAEVELLKKNINKAKEYFEKSVEVDTNCIEGYIGLAKISIEQNNFWDAKKHLKKASEIDENYPELLATYGDLHSNKGDQNTAIKYYKEALSQNKYNNRAKNGLATAILEEYLLDVYSENNDYMIWQLIDPRIVKPE